MALGPTKDSAKTKASIGDPITFPGPMGKKRESSLESGRPREESVYSVGCLKGAWQRTRLS